MADFARILAALDRVCGWTTLADYAAAAAEATEAVLESDPVAQAVFALVESGAWQGTPAELLDRITPDRTPPGWPRSARGLSGRLKRLAPALRAGRGVTYERQGAAPPAGSSPSAASSRRAVARNEPSRPSPPTRTHPRQHRRIRTP